jgi:hypothetical protein
MKTLAILANPFTDVSAQTAVREASLNVTFCPA